MRNLCREVRERCALVNPSSPVEVLGIELIDSLVIASCQSRSREMVEHQPALDLLTMSVDCNCEDFDYRKNQFATSNAFVAASDIGSHCIHIQAMLRACVQQGIVELRKPSCTPKFK